MSTRTKKRGEAVCRGAAALRVVKKLLNSIFRPFSLWSLSSSVSDCYTFPRDHECSKKKSFIIRGFSGGRDSLQLSNCFTIFLTLAHTWWWKLYLVFPDGQCKHSFDRRLLPCVHVSLDIIVHVHHGNKWHCVMVRRLVRCCSCCGGDKHGKYNALMRLLYTFWLVGS